MQGTSDNISGKNKNWIYKKGRVNEMRNKIKILVSFEDEFGNEEIQPVVVEANVPDYKEFENFRESFDMYERAVLRARKEATERATKIYIEEMSKKKAIMRMTELVEK